MGFNDFLRFLGFKGRPRAVRNAHGYTKTTGPFGEIVNADTLQCCHCGGHVEIVVGSGIERGTCWRCRDSNKPGSGFVCGRPPCMAACIPFEKKLENIEAGLPDMTPLAPKILVPPMSFIENEKLGGKK